MSTTIITLQVRVMSSLPGSSFQQLPALESTLSVDEAMELGIAGWQDNLLIGPLAYRGFILAVRFLERTVDRIRDPALRRFAQRALQACLEGEMAHLTPSQLEGCFRRVPGVAALVFNSAQASTLLYIHTQENRLKEVALREWERVGHPEAQGLTQSQKEGLVSMQLGVVNLVWLAVDQVQKREPGLEDPSLLQQELHTEADGLLDDYERGVENLLAQDPVKEEVKEEEDT